MATYLDRYVRGEQELVWAELVALGERVREPGVYADAVAVARETMRRARANVERIVERLRGMSFDFAYPDRVFVPPAPGAADVLEARSATNEGGRMSDGTRQSERQQRRHGFILDLYQQLKRKSQVESAGSPVVSDPLVVEPMRGDDPDAYRYYGPEDGDETDEDGWRGRYAIDVAPDAALKSGYSGGGPYQILLPNAAADAPLLDSKYPTFVSYLCESFRWGGFPGLANYAAPKELVLLTDGLELI